MARIIAGWAQRLGDTELAEQCWATLHGLLMLGHGGDHAAREALALTNGRTELYAPLRQAPAARWPGQNDVPGRAEAIELAGPVASGFVDVPMDQPARLRDAASEAHDAMNASNEDVCLL